MAKVITFSTVFPKGHLYEGKPTLFPELLKQSLTGIISNSKGVITQKHHTIRKGKRWKAGQYFSPRIWSGKPYNSPQQILGIDIEIQQIIDIEMTNEFIILNGIEFNKRAKKNQELFHRIASNDGLTIEEFDSWFKKSIPFSGQIICWQPYLYADIFSNSGCTLSGRQAPMNCQLNLFHQ